jgi:predicted Fe-Mo cluster-binding NifX family protein
MVERIVVPVLDKMGEASPVSPHFGRAPYFAIAEIEPEGLKDLEFKDNTSSHFGGVERPPDLLISFKPDVVITVGMGPRAIRLFQAAGVAVLQTRANTLGEVISAFTRNELQELTEGCRDARHK